MKRMYKRTAWGAAGVIFSLAALGTTAGATEERDLPGVIICSLAGTHYYAYLTSVSEDGVALYMHASGAFAFVGEDGRVTPSDLRVPGDCVGKTIDELRSNGQTREFLK